jgi:hypothetical protein
MNDNLQGVWLDLGRTGCRSEARDLLFIVAKRGYRFRECKAQSDAHGPTDNAGGILIRDDHRHPLSARVLHDVLFPSSRITRAHGTSE